MVLHYLTHDLSLPLRLLFLVDTVVRRAFCLLLWTDLAAYYAPHGWVNFALLPAFAAILRVLPAAIAACCVPFAVVRVRYGFSFTNLTLYAVVRLRCQRTVRCIYNAPYLPP